MSIVNHRCWIVTGVVVMTLWASVAEADVTVFHNFADYDAAVGGIHTLFIDFETDAEGKPLIPSENFDRNEYLDIEGSVFSGDVTYSSPDFPSSRVNFADVGMGVDNEIGPFNFWSGTLRWEYTGNYIATAFSGVELEPDSVVSFYRSGKLVGQTEVGGFGDFFQFFGFVSTEAFDRIDLLGDFYAIDAHYSTIPGPGSFFVFALLARARRSRRCW